MTSPDWTVESYRSKTAAQSVTYPDGREFADVLTQLRALPPLVTSFEIERLKTELAAAQRGERLVLQGGDCAETFAECRSDVIAAKLKILLQMSLVLIHGAERPVTRIGRFAGQYAKPRSKAEETRGDVTLPNYFGDLINRPAFTAEDRRIDPHLMLDGYTRAALTLNFIRSLTDGGFADLHHPEYWDLSFASASGLSDQLREQYAALSQQVGDALRFMSALGERDVDELTRVTFFTSHEGLHLPYEAAMTRLVPRRAGHYCLTAHLPWIGERTRAVDGAHVEFFRGIENPIGVKLGPTASVDDVMTLLDLLNPTNEAGKIVFITRFGHENVGRTLPALLRRVTAEGRRVLWISDPMHGNTTTTESGRKTRAFDAILAEVTRVMEVHRAEGTVFGGVHFELTGEDVTECIGGAGGLTEHDLGTNYATMCDPRLNYAQSLEMAFRVAAELRRDHE